MNFVCVALGWLIKIAAVVANQSGSYGSRLELCLNIFKMCGLWDY